MTRIRFKGFPRYDVAGVSARLTGAPLGTAANVGPLRRLSTQCHISARASARASTEVPIGSGTADIERAREMADGLDVAHCGERQVMAERLVRSDLNADGAPAAAGDAAIAGAAATPAAVAEQGDEARGARRGIPADHVHHDDVRRRDCVDDAGIAKGAKSVVARARSPIA